MSASPLIASGIFLLLLKVNLVRAGGAFLLYPGNDPVRVIVQLQIFRLGTKWCGPGTSAKNYDDLGPAKAEDSCCRTHDHCPDYLPAGQESKERGLKNTAPFSK